MATIQEAYQAACNAGFIKRNEFSEEAFGNMLQNDNNRRAYYDHVTKIDPTFYSKDYDTFSQNVLSALGQPAAKNSTNQPSNAAPAPSQVQPTFQPAQGQPTFWQSIGAHDPYPQKTAEGVAQFEREQQLQRESAATLPLSQQDKDRQSEIQRLQAANGALGRISAGQTPINQDEIDRLKAEQPSYITREIKTPQDLYTSVSEAWAANTPDGQKAKAELDKTAQDTYNNLMADMNRQIAGLQQQVNAGTMSVEEAQKQVLQIADDTNAIYEEEMQLAQNHFFNQMADANTDYLSQQKRLLGQKATNQTISDINARIAPHIRQLETERQQAMQRASQSVQAQGGMYGAIGASMSANTAYKPEKDQELALYHQSQQFLADAAKISDAAQKGEGFWKGLGKSLGDIDTWDFGISQLTRSANLKDIVEKYERGEQLTDAEKGLMDSAVAYMSACAYNSDKINRRYKMGQTTGESIPFMLQFMVMPIGAIKDKVAKGVLGYGIEQFGGKAAQAAGKVAAKYGAKTAFKEAGTALLSNLAAAGVQTAAFGVPKIAEGAISRMTGDIQPTITEQGNIAYNGRRNQQSAASAVWNSAVDMYAENLSEMILTSLDPLKAYAGTAKLFSGLKNSQIAQVLGRLNEGVIGKVRDRVQFRNYLEEVGEEYVGNLIRWGLSTDVNNAEDAGLSADRQIDTWLGLAPTSIAFGAANIVEGGIDRFQSSRAAKRLREIMADGDKRRYLESLLKSRNSDDFSKNAHEVIKSVLRDKELNEDTKRLIMDGIYYTYQSQLAQEAEQARVQAEAERQTQPEQQPEQSAQQEIGQQTASAAESEANQEGEEHYQDADGNEVTFYRNADGSVSLRDENDNAAVDEHGNAVVLTQAEFDKYTQDTNLRRVDRELSADQWAERENELRQQYASEIRPNTHNDGNVYEVALAIDGNKHGYIVGDGNVEIDDTTDHAAPRITNSDVVTVRYEDGTMEQVAAKDLNLLSVGSANDIVEQRLQPFQQYAQAMQTFRAGQEVTMDDGSGNTYTSHVVSVSTDGVEVEIENAQGEPDTTIIPNEIALTALHPVEQRQRQPEQQVEKQEPFEFVKTDPFGNPIVVEQPEQIPTTPQKIVPNIDTMLADELGASVVEYLGDKASAIAYLEAERDKADDDVKRLAKQKVTRYTDIADFKRQNDELQAAKKAAADRYNKLQNAIATANNYKTKVEQAAEAERKAREEERRATRRQTQTAQLANAAPAERWKAAPKVEGNAVTRTLSDGTVIKGHYVLVEAGAATPSHDPFNGWNTSNGFPVTEDGKNINDRDYKNDTDAQQITTQIAQTYDGQAVAQVPVVSSEGIVYDGNGRTIAGNIAAANSTDGAYIQALADNAGNFGFTAEQVAGMQHPRVYMQTDEDLPYNTTTFAKFNAQEKKSQGSTNRAVSSSKKLTEAARDGMLRILDNYGTLDAFFASETGAKDIVRSLLDNGIITQQEVAGLTETTDKGFVLSPAGKDYVTDLLIGGLFDEQTIRMLGNDKGLKQSILRALPSIVENRRLGDYALTDNINGAIRLLYEARQAGMAYPLYVKQGNAFDGYVSDRFSPFEMLLAEEMSSGVETFRQVLNLYNNSARDEANGQTGLFEPRSVEDIKNEILQHYEKSTNQSAFATAAPTPSRPANAQTESPVPSTPTGDEQGGIASAEQVNNATEESSRPNEQAEHSKANNRRKNSKETPMDEQPKDGGSKQSQLQQSENKIFTDDAYEAARRRMHERLNRLNAGLDPEMLSDGLIMAGYHVEKGARKFAEFAREMIREFGDKIRPYLKSFYNGLRDLPEAAELSKEMDDYGTVAQFDVNRISIEEPKAQNNKPNGLMEQYSEIKKQYPNALLLFRMGDDYELYAQDAVDASKILNIGSSTTNRLGEQTIFAQFPYQALDSFLPKLVRAGRRVAICDPIENIQTAKSGALEVVTPQEMAESTEKSSETLPSNEKSVSLQSANAEDTQPIGKVTQSKHTKTGEDIWIVKPSERVSDDEFKLLKARAKANNGYYSSFAKNRGFIFKSKEDANNFNNISDEEITTDQTSADTETAVRTAETVVGETATITRDKRDSNRAEGEPGTESIEGGVREPRNVELTPEQANEQVTTRQQAIAKIDNANDKITDQLAVLGFYEADTSDPTKLHESYGYIKTAEAKAVKDIDRLAKQLADDLGINVSKRKTIAKANIAPAGGDISFRLPLENGKELYLSVDVEPNFNNYYRADGDANSLVADHMFWRIEDPQANGTSRYLTPNQNYGLFERGQVTTTYADLLRDIRRMGRDYLSAIPTGTTMQEIAKQVAEKATRKKKDTTRIADTQSMRDLFGDVADTMNEGVQQEQDEPERKFVNAVSRHLLGALVSEDMQTPFRSILDLRKLAKESGIEVDDNGKTDILLQELVEDGLVRAARQLVASGKYGDAKSKATYDAIVHLYEIQPTIAQRSSNRIAMQQYSTPLPMAFVADMFAYEPNMRSILEPTAGNGMLVFAVPAEKVHANELDETRLANLHLQEFQEVTSQDATEPFGGGKRYDAIIANPPFGSREEREYDGKMIAGLDPQITLNALASMKDSGKAAIIIGGNMEYADNGSVKDKKAFWSYLYDHYNVKGVVDMDGQLYRKQGTTYPTRMILIDGRRSEAEREQTTVYPPIQQKAIAKVNTFDDLYNTIAEITNSNKKTNGTEILRTTGGSSSVSDSNNTSGNTGVLGHSGQHRSNDGDGRDGGQRPTDSAGSAGGNRPNAERGVSTTPRTGGGKVSGHPMGGVLRPQEPVHGLNTTSDDGSSARPERATTDGERSGEDNVGRPGRVLNGGIQTLGTASDRVGLKSQPKRNLTEEKLPYRSHNTAFSLQSVAPAAMVEAMDNTLSQIEKSVGKSIDQFVTDELGYDTIQDAHNALAAEQMDSVAMAIYQMKQGQALIIGDQTGVGKGRQMAALIRWAVRQGKKPIFITQKADLFSDIYRDLVDIGSGDLHPFIFNSATAKDGKGIVVDANGNEIYKALSNEKTKLICLQSSELPDGFDYVLATYSQFNNGDNISRKAGTKKKKELDEESVAKATFLRKLSRNNYLFLDESHTAAGDSNIGAFFQSIIGTKIDSGVRAVTFASATFAKRPDTMPMYALRTAMAEANVEREKLIGIIEKGGVTLQEIMSRALTESGQMVRRERDMSDVRTDWKTIDDPTIVKQAREQYDRTIVAFNAIIDFQDKFITPLVKEQDRELAEVMSTANLKKGTKKFGVDNTPFASKTFNYTKQLMLALKVDAIVDEVEREIKAGRHPVIALESTMESTIKDYTPGETIAEPSFSASLLKGLDNCMQYTIKDDQGVETHMTYTPNELGEEGETAYYKLQDFIRESTKDIFISPLDAIIERLHEKGYRVGELTGRNTYVERTDDGKIVVRRRTDKDKKRMQREFNSGALDVLILNKSASTGISLHASEKFSDQRQRSMIIAQPLSDINDYMQMIGRIDRTGQVHRGYYINLGLPVPAESRFLMMLSTKLKSLNANTTTSQDSESNEVDAPDLLNKYGSQVVIEYLRDNPTIYEKIGEPLKKNSKKGDDKIIHANELDEYTPSEDDALKITGRVALLNTKEQEEFYNDVVRRYNDLIRYLNDTGTNDLKITTLPLRAKTISRKVSSVGREPNGNNPFAGNAYVEQVEMDVLRKPMKANEVQKLIVQLNGTSDRAAGRKRVKDIMSIVERETEDKMTLENERYENAKQKAALTLEEYARKINANEKMSSEQKATTIEQKQQETEQKLADKNRDNILSIQHKAAYLNRMLDMFTVGETYLVPDDLGSAMFSSSTHSIFCGYKVKDNKISASTSFAVFATLDGRRKVEIKLSDISILNRINDHTNQNWDAAQQTTLDNWDKQIPTQTRKEGYIMTGNILQAVADTQDEYGNYTGQLISYTDIDGNIHDGILMPDKWKASQLRGGVPISARLEQMKQGTVVSTDGKVTIRRGWGAPDVYFLIVPKSKSEGGKYFLNPDILRLVEGNNFYTVRGHMQAEVPAQNIEAVLGILSDMGVKAQDSTIEAQYDELDYDIDNLTDAQQFGTDVVLGALDDAGISVERVSEEQAEREVAAQKKSLDDTATWSELMVRANKAADITSNDNAKVLQKIETAKRKLETATWREDNLHTKNAADVSSLDDAKVRQKIDISKQKLENQSTKSIKNPVSFISDILELRQTGSSYYGTFKLQDGSFITLRLSNHNATVSNFDNEGETEGVSIVISAHPSEGIRNDGTAHVVEYFYRKKDLWNAYGTPLADILGDISELLRTGEYKDTTGLAQRQEVNIPAELQSAEFSIRQTPAPKNTGIGYKVFYRGKDGKLYPPMVANPNGADTPIGVWLNADAAPISGESKTGRLQVKAGGKGTQGGSGQLAYRPGWHLGEIPYALQFNRKDENGDKTLFPKDFVWAEVEYAADVNYQQEAEKEGITENGKYRHSYAGLKHLPTDGYYRYRTNPNPETDPWIITGAMKVNRVLTNEEVDDLVRKAGREPQQREFLRTSNGTIYGYAKDGKIYLTDNGFNPNTPIHEYTHLWVKAVRNNNPELYNNLRDLFSRENLPDMWDELDHAPQYRDLSDEAKLSEIVARFSGKRGAERMEQEAQKLIDDAKQQGKRAVANAISLRERMRNLLRRFWNWVGEHLFHIKYFGSREEAADRVLYDLLNGTDLGQTHTENDSQAEFSTSPMPKRMDGEMVHEWAKRIAEWKRQQVDEQQVAEYAKLLDQNGSKKSKVFAYIVDKFTSIDNFQQWVQAQGGVYNPDTMDMHSDISLALGRIETYSRRYKNDYMQRIADSITRIVKDDKIADPLLALGFKWQNFDNKKMNGKPLTVREIMGVYAQAKDTWEADKQGLSDRGAQGFVKNLGVSHTDIIEAVERIIPQKQLDEFWNAVYAANQFALDYQLNAGMLDTDTRNRYTRRYYVPQRGWRERDFDGRDTAYIKGNGTRLYGNPYNAALVKAHGRESLASDPFALIESIGLTSITQSEHNKSKQQLLNLLLANEMLGLKSGAWRVKQVWSKNVIDPRTGHIMRKPDGTPVQAEVTYAAPTQQEREHDADINARIDQLRKELRDLTQPAARAKRENEIADLQDQLIYTGRATDTMLEHRTRDERLQHQIIVLHNGQQYVIELQDERLANAVNGNFGEAVKAYALFNKYNAPAIRYISGMLTQYNPRFAHRNFWRDAQAAFLNNLSEQGVAFTTRAMANIPMVQRTVWRYILADTYKGKEEYTSLFGDYLREYFEAGAQTGFSFMPELERMAKDFNKMVKGENAWDKVWGKGVKGTLSLMTEASELTVRFAEYVTARQMGRSVQAAAKMAKNISVNFNQSGLMSKEMSKFFTFFNATIQGNMRFLMPYGKNKPKFGERAFKFGAKFAGMAANFALLGLLSTFLQPDNPDDDTWFTEYDRMSNFILFGKVKIPVVHFFRMYYAAGVQAALAAQGRKTWKDAFYTSAGYIHGEFVPSSALQFLSLLEYDETTNTLELNPAKYAQAAAPSVISPLVDVAVNRDFKGSTVYRKKWDNDKKDITTAKRSTPQWAVDVSNTLHRWSGGNPDVPYKGGNTDGWIDIKPNAIEHLAQGYFSGVWESLGQTAGFIWDGAHDTDVYKHATNWPFLRDLFRDYSEDKAYNGQYYSVLQKLEKYEKRVNTLSRDEFKAEKQTNRFRTFKQVSKQLRRLPNPYDDEEATVTSEDVNKILQLDIKLNRNLFAD